MRIKMIGDTGEFFIEEVQIERERELLEALSKFRSLRCISRTVDSFDSFGNPAGVCFLFRGPKRVLSKVKKLIKTI